MTLELFGTIEDRGCEQEGCETCPYRVFEEDDDSKQYDGCIYEISWKKVFIAIELWNLLGEKEKAQKLSDMKEKLGKRLYHNFFETDEYVVPSMTIPEIQEILSLVEGLNKALYTITDSNSWHHIKPEYVDCVLEQAPDLVTSWKSSEGGNWVHTLWNSLAPVLSVQMFLKKALELGREVEYE